MLRFRLSTGVFGFVGSPNLLEMNSGGRGGLKSSVPNVCGNGGHVNNVTMTTTISNSAELKTTAQH